MAIFNSYFDITRPGNQPGFFWGSLFSDKTRPEGGEALREKLRLVTRNSWLIYPDSPPQKKHKSGFVMCMEIIWDYNSIIIICDNSIIWDYNSIIP
jgi:hypothetical protein